MCADDKRVQKTKKLIYDTYFKLAQGCGISRITIKSLCENANISRRTFYFHYETIDAFIDEVLDMIFPMVGKEYLETSLEKYAELHDTASFDFWLMDYEKYLETRRRQYSDELDILMSKKNAEVFLQLLYHKVDQHIRSILGNCESSSPSDLDITGLQTDTFIDSYFSAVKWLIEHRHYPLDEVIAAIHPASLKSFLDFTALYSDRRPT